MKSLGDVDVMIHDGLVVEESDARVITSTILEF